MKINPITIEEAWIAPNDETRVNYILKEGGNSHEFQTPVRSKLGQLLLSHIDRAKAMELALSRGRNVPSVNDWREAKRRNRLGVGSGQYGRPLFRSPAELDHPLNCDPDCIGGHP
jgi:hypothetical protein